MPRKPTPKQTVASQVQKHLEDEAQFYRELFQKQPDAELVVNRDGVIERCTEQATAFLGYERDALVGQLIDILLPERVKKSHSANIKRFFSNPFTRPMGVNLNITVVAKIGEDKFEEKLVTIYLAGVLYPGKGPRALAVIRSKDA